MAYSDLMKKHLGRYKTDRLGIRESGMWRNREYAHILPAENKLLNILAPIQQEFVRYRESRPGLKLHRDFAHLNSSQAACINLFLPLFAADVKREIPDHLPLPFNPKDIAAFEFEHIPNEIEGTNFDLWVQTSEREEVFCEFKLTESEFGRARDDARHRQKLLDIYYPMLTGKVVPEVLEPANFFARYQLLRNVAYAEATGLASVLFVVPKANERLTAPLAEMHDWLMPGLRPFVSVVHIEDIVSALRSTQDVGLKACYEEYAAKYVPAVAPT